MITPEQLANSGSEHGEQAALFCWAQQKMQENFVRYAPLYWMFAIPNGGERNKAVAGKLKAEGVKAGVSDVFLPWPKPCTSGHVQAGLFIEMKANNNEARLSKEQSSFLAQMRSVGYDTAVCFGWLEAVAAIENYLNR